MNPQEYVPTTVKGGQTWTDPGTQHVMISEAEEHEEGGRNADAQDGKADVDEVGSVEGGDGRVSNDGVDDDEEGEGRMPELPDTDEVAASDINQGVSPDS